MTTTLLPCTIAYITSLLQPYYNIINTSSLDDIAKWIPVAISYKIGTDTLQEFNAYRRIPGTTIDEIRSHLTLFLMGVVLEDVTEHNRAMRDSSYTTPWNAQRALSASESFSRMFNLDPRDRTLSVTAVINGQPITHMLSEEFTVGLLIASKVKADTPEFTIIMYGTVMDDTFLYVEEAGGVSEYDLHLDVFEPEYSVEISNHTFAFQTDEFMQGFITGCQWRQLDHHHYWKHFTQYTYTEENTFIPTSLQIN